MTREKKGLAKEFKTVEEVLKEQIMNHNPNKTKTKRSIPNKITLSLTQRIERKKNKIKCKIENLRECEKARANTARGKGSTWQREIQTHESNSI